MLAYALLARKPIIRYRDGDDMLHMDACYHITSIETSSQLWICLMKRLSFRLTPPPHLSLRNRCMPTYDFPLSVQVSEFGDTNRPDQPLNDRKVKYVS